MIEDEDIARFPPEQQRKIREQMTELMGNGRARPFLRLMPNGSVVYDPQLEEEAIDLGRD
jgi:hypothetical protein